MRHLLFFIYQIYLEEKCSFIGINAIFVDIPVFPHGIKGIFISNSAVIGKNCIIFQQVVIGSNTVPLSKKLGAPKIGDDVLIGAGATIIGGVKVGCHVRIGANCTVVEDVPDNCVVVANKPRIIQKESIDNTASLN